MKLEHLEKFEVQGTEDAYKGVELMHVHNLSKDTTLGEVENLLSMLFQEVENGEIVYLG